MASPMTTGLRMSESAQVVSCADAPAKRLRRTTPQAGHALEILGHAIGYLTDEFVHQGAEMSSSSAQLEAVQLLMSLNRQIYFECPEVPTLGERFRSLMRFPAA